MTDKTALLHIGYPKTGTTSIQRMLFEGARVGMLPGVSYHLPFPRNMNSQHLLWALFRRNQPLSRWPQYEYDRLSANGPVEPALDDCWQRIEASENAVFSSEYLTVWSAAEVTALAARLRAAGFGRIHVVAYVREPTDLYLSFVQQQIRAASYFTLPHLFRTGYEQTIERFRSAFGGVEIRVFDRHRLKLGCVVRDFATVLERVFDTKIDPERLIVTNSNDSLSGEAMIALLEWRRAHYGNVETVSLEGNRIVKLLLESRSMIAQRSATLKPPLARLVERMNVGDVEYLRRIGVVFDSDDHDDGTLSPIPSASADDVTSILEAFDPCALHALRALLRDNFRSIV